MSDQRKATRIFEIRAAQGEEFVLAGRALSYNEISSNEIIPGVREKIMPGAFKRSIASGNPVFALLNHDMKALPLGRTDNSTLSIKDSDEGLDFRVQLDKNNTGHRDVYAAVQRKDIRECSFQFCCEDETFEDARYGGRPTVVRCVRQAELIDISVVLAAFYGKGATSVSARAADVAVDEHNRARCAAIGEEIRQERFAEVAKLVEADVVWLKRINEVPNN